MTVKIAGVLIKSVQRGDDPQWHKSQVVQCGYCDAEIPVFCHGRGLLPPEGVKKRVDARGWKFVSTGRHACPKCLAVFKAKSKSKSKETTKMVDDLRTATTEDRSRIRIEIDDNYDTDKKRYLGNCTDAEIAKKLKVPRQWVSEVREFGFGPSGGNDDMHKIAGALRTHVSDADKILTKALSAAVSAEVLKAEFEKMQKRVDALVASFGP